MQRDVKFVVSKKSIRITLDEKIHYDVKTVREASDILTVELCEEDLLEVTKALVAVVLNWFE